MTFTTKPRQGLRLRHLHSSWAIALLPLFGIGMLLLLLGR